LERENLWFFIGCKYNIILNMSAERAILEYLKKIRGKRPIKYKGMRVGFLGLPDFKYYKYQTLAKRCSDLIKKGYIKENNNGEYFISYKGEEFLEKGDTRGFKKFNPIKTDKDPKDLLILYDIPQNQTSTRNWFRRELQKFHFIMIQRSVWVGPSPLPKDFIEYLREVKIEKDFKTFKLEKGYKTTVDNNL
jgi:CRISPR-associated endonuclease Cas2